MIGARRILYRALLASGTCLSPSRFSCLATFAPRSPEPLRGRAAGGSPASGSVGTPWAAIQRRGAKVLGSDVRFGNVIQRKGRIYQVIKTQHTQHGRGGATIQVELRDVDSGSKITERFRTDEALESVFVEDKTLTFLYQEGDIVTLMNPSTFEQIEVSKELFGKNYSYLKEEMSICVQYFDGKPMSASVPQRVTCTVVQAQPHTKGLTLAPQGVDEVWWVQPSCLTWRVSSSWCDGRADEAVACQRISAWSSERYKKVVLDNGLTVMVPPFIEAGDEIVLNTTEDKYLERAKN